MSGKIDETLEIAVVCVEATRAAVAVELHRHALPSSPEDRGDYRECPGDALSGDCEEGRRLADHAWGTLLVAATALGTPIPAMPRVEEEG